MKKILLSLVFLNQLLNSTSLEEADFIKKKEGILKAIPLYKELIKQNNTQAMNTLALIYLKGHGIQKNINKAYSLLQTATSLLDTQATYNLAKLYSSKKTRYYNEVKAYNLLVDNTQKFHAKSQTMLAKFFLFGIAVEKDYEKALYYFKEASKQKEFNANCYIAYIYANALGVHTNLGRAHNFAIYEYEKGNKICKKVWKDYNLVKYTKDKGWKFGSYNKPIR